MIPAGGGMEYGEHSRDTAAREIREELGVSVDPDFLGVVENHFTHRGQAGHDIEFLYIASIDLETRSSMRGEVIESNGERFPVTWFALDELAALSAKVAPTGILEMLAGLAEN